MHKFYSAARISGDIYVVKMTVDESYSPGQKNTNKKFYHVRSIKIEKVADYIGSLTHGNLIHGAESASDVSTTKFSICEVFDFVKNFDEDFKFRPVNPKLLNTDGTPKAFYRDTEDGSEERVPIEEYGFPNYSETFETDFSKGIVDRLSAAIKMDRAGKIGYQVGGRKRAQRWSTGGGRCGTNKRSRNGIHCGIFVFWIGDGG